MAANGLKLQPNINKMSLPDTNNYFGRLDASPQSAVKCRAEGFVAGERKRNLNRLFGNHRQTYERLAEHVEKIGGLSPEALGTSLLRMLEEVYELCQPLTKDKAGVVIRDLSEMTASILSFEFQFRELVVQALVLNPKASVLRQLLKLDLKDFGDVIIAGLNLTLELSAASPAIVNRLWDHEMLTNLASLVEKANVEIAGAALLTLGNLLTYNHDVREAVTATKLLEPLTKTFSNDLAGFNDASPPETVQLIKQYFYFFGGYFNMAPYPPYEAFVPYIRPFLVAFCDYDGMFGEHLSYIVEFMGSLTLTISESALMEQLEPFAPVIGHVIVRHLTNPSEEVRRKILTFIAIMTRFDDTQLLRIFEGTDFIERMASILPTLPPSWVHHVAHISNNFIYCLDQPICRAYLENQALWDQLRTYLPLREPDTFVPILEAFNVFLRNKDEPAVQGFCYRNPELFNEVRECIDNGLSNYNMMLLMQIYDNIVGVGWRLKDRGFDADNSFLRHTAVDDVFLNKLKFISEHNEDELVRQQAVDMIQECADYVAANGQP